MPSQFRFFGSNPEPTQALFDSSAVTPSEPSPDATRANVGSLTDEHDNRTTVPASEPPDQRNDSFGLHEVVKSTDFWFSYELSLLEKYAVNSAVQWAQAGIPRQDAPVEGELPIETTLKARASE